MDHMIAFPPKKYQVLAIYMVKFLVYSHKNEQCIYPLCISWVSTGTKEFIFISKGKHDYKFHLRGLGQMTFLDDAPQAPRRLSFKD